MQEEEKKTTLQSIYIYSIDDNRRLSKVTTTKERQILLGANQRY